MYSLSVAEAKAAVRKNLDEIGLNESVMYDTESTDNASLDETIARCLPEAINRIHLAAPVNMLEGTMSLNFDSFNIRDGVMRFTIKGTEKFLRLVAFRADDSDVVITEAIPEDSPEGRKQLNRYIRGTSDRPRLVKLAGTQASFAYYTVKDSSQGYLDAIAQLSFVKEQFYSDGAASYPVSAALRQNALDTLTARVLAIYGENEKANYFAEKAKPI